MKHRTVCSAISYVVALVLTLPGQALATPADVSGAEPLSPANFKQVAVRYTEVKPVKPSLHIEELSGQHLSQAQAALAMQSRSGNPDGGYDPGYIAQFQESLTKRLSSELEQRISNSSW